MFKFGLKNVRRLKEVNPIDIRPITVLVGRNSSGKSTFLRTFPLLRQSLMTKTSSPILWYGDLVDFGTFKGVASENKLTNPIVFTFILDAISISEGPYAFLSSNSLEDVPVGPITVELRISGYNNKTVLSGFRLSIDSEDVVFDAAIDEKGELEALTINNKSADILLKHHKLTFELGAIFPNIFMLPGHSDQIPGYYMQTPFAILLAIRDLIAPHLDKRLSEHQLTKIASELLTLRSFGSIELEMLQGSTNVRSFAKLIADMRGKNVKKLKDDVRSLVLLSRFTNASVAAFQHLTELLSGTLYIGPMRARSERYYRYQDLAVSEIDPDGKNFPMFLNSLTERQQRSFSNWVQNRFGYGVQVSQLEGHISINLTVGKTSTNIVDNGYGISQVLPVLGQIWWASSKPEARGPNNENAHAKILAIEQPELHLHPAHQALIADAMVGEYSKSSRPRGQPLHFLVETHSEALINRLGELVVDEKINHEDIQILVFENDLDDEFKTNVRIAEFSSEGTLKNWPYGFFQPVL
ncbi:AAA family ATPase [Phyllobacterium ifriqiyense]|uniref:AAA family ATPase n=1 Tax=Phyllobacterium ifriqiyense TaxID=314238 RepID=UPI00339424AE